MPKVARSLLLTRIVRYVMVGILKLYQKSISYITRPRCRFYPSCSQYAVTAFKRFGFIQACGLIVRRLLKCHPLHPGGYDPVPPVQQKLRHKRRLWK